MGEYILLLNPDTIVHPGSLDVLIKFMDENSDVSVLGVKHINNDGNIAISCSRFPSVKNFIFDIFGLSKLSLWWQCFMVATR